MSAIDDTGAEYLVLRDLEATHARRVRLLVVVTSVILILAGFWFALVFFIKGSWLNGCAQCLYLAIGITCALLARRGQMRIAVSLMLLSLFLIFCAIALFADVPTPRVPRAIHFFLIPLAFGSYLLLKTESAWLRHGFSLLCLSAFVLFSRTSFGFDVGLYVPDDLHAMIDWAGSVCAMAVLYLLLHIFMGDVGRMENYLYLANNRFVSLVANIFPKIVAERLLADRKTFADRYADCSVLFADIVGFTEITERMAPEELIAMLSEVFLRFDDCVEQFGLTKIKTIGDAYMVAAGVPEPNANHARQTIDLATQMLDVVKEFQGVKLRIGIASGELVAGVIGQSRQVYDVWGDVVNLASRMESHGLPNQIQVSESTYMLVKHIFNFEQRSGIAIKGKYGKHNAYLLSAGLVSPELCAG